jgi:hypothetical protein
MDIHDPQAVADALAELEALPLAQRTSGLEMLFGSLQDALDAADPS